MKRTVFALLSCLLFVCPAHARVDFDDPVQAIYGGFGGTSDKEVGFNRERGDTITPLYGSYILRTDAGRHTYYTVHSNSTFTWKLLSSEGRDNDPYPEYEDLSLTYINSRVNKSHVIKDLSNPSEEFFKFRVKEYYRGHTVLRSKAADSGEHTRVFRRILYRDPVSSINFSSGGTTITTEKYKYLAGYLSERSVGGPWIYTTPNPMEVPAIITELATNPGSRNNKLVFLPTRHACGRLIIMDLSETSGTSELTLSYPSFSLYLVNIHAAPAANGDKKGSGKLHRVKINTPGSCGLGGIMTMLPEMSIEISTYDLLDDFTWSTPKRKNYTVTESVLANIFSDIEDEVGFSCEKGVSVDKFVLGDSNGDGTVNSYDLDDTRAFWGEEVPACSKGDPNCDGLVNSDDLDMMRGNWGAVADPVPDPDADPVS